MQGHVNYLLNIVAKFYTTEHQSCQEPETLSIRYTRYKIKSTIGTRLLWWLNRRNTAFGKDKHRLDDDVITGFG